MKSTDKRVEIECNRFVQRDMDVSGLGFLRLAPFVQIDNGVMGHDIEMVIAKQVIHL